MFVFPDYCLYTGLSTANVSTFARSHLSPSLESNSTSFQSHKLPYYAVLLVCSHKRRDNRCSITAGPMINALTHAIESLGHDWHVDVSGNDIHSVAEAAEGGDKTVGIFKCSHVGGHRYAGNVMVWLPNGVNVWYARVREKDCGILVQKTLVEGKVVGDFLRGGLGLGGREGGSILKW